MMVVLGGMFLSACNDNYLFQRVSSPPQFPPYPPTCDFDILGIGAYPAKGYVVVADIHRGGYVFTLSSPILVPSPHC